MINGLILNASNNFAQKLEQDILKYYPQINLSNICCSKENYIDTIQEKNPELIFLEIEDIVPSKMVKLIQNITNKSFEIILITSNKDFIYKTIQYNLGGYILKPLQPKSFISTIDNVIKRIALKKKPTKTDKQSNSFLSQQILGIPTMEGYEVILIQDIIRCESYLKCTRVITSTRSDIISSYNIGEFIKQLEKYGFYAPHQSHLINLCKVKKYLKEGTIIMCNDSAIPVARRRRVDFMQHIPHI